MLVRLTEKTLKRQLRETFRGLWGLWQEEGQGRRGQPRGGFHPDSVAWTAAERLSGAEGPSGERTQEVTWRAQLPPSRAPAPRHSGQPLCIPNQADPAEKGADFEDPRSCQTHTADGWS